VADALRLEDLRKTYRNGHVALDGITMTVPEGDFFALLGPNGAGKSTTIGILASLVVKTGGKAWIFGHDIETDFARARLHLGLVPQEFNFNVWEPVVEILINQAGYYGIPRRRAARRAEALLHELGLWDKRNQQARNLSGGMKRRLMIARALVHEPRLLILDEPTAGVDIELRRHMWAFLRAINARGTTIILTTHYLEEAEALCRHIAIIDHGRLVENTALDRLLERLHEETFVLYLREAVDELPDLTGLRLRRIDARTLEVDVPREAGLNPVFAALDAAGIQVLSMRAKANRLEEVFMSLVGHGPGPGARAGTEAS
jgi:ABC-2 type transport system ATP-binding protein